MIKKIRHNVFETNSSSTHSICIAKDISLTIPKEIHFSKGEFGWEINTLRSLFSKASYLYTALENDSRFHDVVGILEAEGLTVTYDISDEGYIDHSGELSDFLDKVCKDKDSLMSYLFSDLSYIKTGNDNDDNDVDIVVDYPHELFYKGN
jgi:hypothetical protein